MLVFLLQYIIPGFVIIPLLVFVCRFRIFPAALKVLFFYLLTAGIINTAAIILANKHHHNLWLLHIYTIIETVYFLVFFRLISPSAAIKKSIMVLLVVFPLLCIANMFFLEPTLKYNSYTRSFEALLLIFFSVAYWFGYSEQNTNATWYQNPYNWIISGIMLYFASSFFLFLLSNVILTTVTQQNNPANKQFAIILWTFHGLLFGIEYLLFAVGFSKYKK